jgi:hypothetical protein
MKIKRPILGWTILTTMIIVVVIALVQLSSSGVMLRWVKREVRNQISTRINGEFDFKELGLTLLPRPTISIRNGRLLLPDKMLVYFSDLEVQPAVMPFITGTFRIKRIKISDPEIQLAPFSFGSPSNNLNPPFFSDDMADRAAHMVAQLIQKYPNSITELENGTLTFSNPENQIVKVSQIKAAAWIKADRILLTANAGSKMIQNLNADLQFFPKPVIAKGKIVFTGLATAQLQQNFSRQRPWIFAKTVADGEVGFEIKSFTDFSVNCKGKARQIHLVRADHSSDLSDLNLSMALRRSHSRTTVQLKHLTLSKPDLNLKGDLNVTGMFSQPNPVLDLTLLSPNINLISLRKTLIDVAGDFPWVQQVTAIIKAGTVSNLKLHSSANSLEYLIKSDQLELEAQLAYARLQLPWLAGEIKQVDGNVRISKGRLLAEQLKATLGRSKALQGKLALDLKKDTKSFELNLNLVADLKDVYSSLDPILKKTKVADVVAAIKKIGGEARGQLNLNNKSGPLETKVNLEHLKMAVTHKRLPGQLTLSTDRLFYTTSHLSFSNLDCNLLKSHLKGLEGNFDWGHSPTFNLKLRSKMAKVSLADLFAWATSFAVIRNRLTPIQTMRGTIWLANSRIKGPIFKLNQWTYSAQGHFSGLFIKSDHLFSPLSIASGHFQITPSSCSGRWQAGTLFDSTVSGNFLIKDYRGEIGQLELITSGDVGPRTLIRLKRSQFLPRWINIDQMIHLNQAKIHWRRHGDLLFSAELESNKGIHLSAAGLYRNDTLRLDKLIWKDAFSRFNARLDFKDGRLQFTFSGYLSSDSIKAIYPKIPFEFNRLEGVIDGSSAIKAPFKMHLNGGFTLLKGVYRLNEKSLFVVDQLVVDAALDQLQIQTAELTWENNSILIYGDVNLGNENPLIDLDVTSDRLDLTQLKEAASQIASTSAEKKKNRFLEYFPLQGIVRVRVEKVCLNRMDWSDLRANLAFNRDHVDIQLENINLCGLIFKGDALLSSDHHKFDLWPYGHKLPIQSTFHCLHSSPIKVDGSFDLEGKITGQDRAKEFGPSLGGKLKFSAHNGRIYEDNILAKILAVINLTEIFAGQMPDLGKEGFGYNDIQMNLSIDGGQIKLVEGYIDGRSMTISGQGSFDIGKQTVDLKVLVAPFKTIDRIIRYIPIVNYILKGSLIMIPLKIEGDLASPTVVPLAPRAVGEELIGIMKRTLKLPFKIIPFAEALVR